MHGYLRSIGFKDLKKKNEIDLLIQDIVDHPDKKILTEDEEGNIFAELTREFSEFTGIAVRGFYIDNEFHVEYYYPYFAGSGISTEERVDIQKRSDREAYAGICDEMRIGVTLIFYLQNAVEYLQEIPHDIPNQFSVADKGGIFASVECFPNRVYVKWGDRYLVHSNHNVFAEDEEEYTCSKTTWDRYEVMEQMVEANCGNIDVEMAKEFFKSHERFPNSICSHPYADKPWNKTLAAMVFDLGEGVMNIAFGNACEVPYHKYQFERYL